MLVRLAYSIAIQIPFDVLLLDEVLAVGDQAFQEKCFATFERFKEEGKTIVFVSHALDLVEPVLRSHRATPRWTSAKHRPISRRSRRLLPRRRRHRLIRDAALSSAELPPAGRWLGRVETATRGSGIQSATR